MVARRIITETDLFKVFLELLGARKPGVRLTVLVADIPGKLFELTGVIRDLGGNLISVGTFMGEDPTTINLTIKVSHVSAEALEKAIEPMVQKIVDIREMKAVPDLYCIVFDFPASLSFQEDGCI